MHKGDQSVPITHTQHSVGMVDEDPLQRFHALQIQREWLYAELRPSLRCLAVSTLQILAHAPTASAVSRPPHENIKSAGLHCRITSRQFMFSLPVPA